MIAVPCIHESPAVALQARAACVWDAKRGAICVLSTLIVTRSLVIPPRYPPRLSPGRCSTTPFTWRWTAAKTRRQSWILRVETTQTVPETPAPPLGTLNPVKCAIGPCAKRLPMRKPSCAFVASVVLPATVQRPVSEHTGLSIRSNASTLQWRARDHYPKSKPEYLAPTGKGQSKS